MPLEFKRSGFDLENESPHKSSSTTDSMAAVTLGLLTFSGHEDKDIDAFIHLVHGYFNAINLAPVGNSARCMGLFRACFKGDAAVWFDDNILGKRWSLHNLYNNHGQAAMAGIQG